jgi:P-type Mg2+ transporter
MLESFQQNTANNHSHDEASVASVLLIKPACMESKQMLVQKTFPTRLRSINNFGTMKSYLINFENVAFESALDADGADNDKVLFFGFLNALYETGLPNSLDEAIRACKLSDGNLFSKLDEIPYDHIRKRVSILVNDPSENNIMITKGAFESILECCDNVELPSGDIEGIREAESRIKGIWKILATRGFRTQGVAYKKINTAKITQEDESCMTFLGIISFYEANTKLWE